jgi:hypothetical protein
VKSLNKILDLIASRQSDDFSQACALLGGLSPSEQAKIFSRTEIDREHGRLKLPFLSQIALPESHSGMSELRLLMASTDPSAVKLRNQIKSLCVNCENKENGLFIGAKESETGAIFHQYFPSLESLSALPSLEDLSIAKVNKLDLNGIEKIARLQKLKIDGVGELSGWSSLEQATQLRQLDLNEVPSDAIEFTGAFGGLESLALNFYVPYGVSSAWPSISGLGNLKNLKTLAIGGTIESLAGIENLHKLETIQFSMWSDFKDISSLINRLHRRKTSFTLNQLQIINS